MLRKRKVQFTFVAAVAFLIDGSKFEVPALVAESSSSDVYRAYIQAIKDYARLVDNIMRNAKGN